MRCDICETEVKREAHISVQRLRVSEVGSCNFCNRQITEHGNRIGAMVREVSSDAPGGIRVRFCDTCWSQLGKG